MSEQTPENKSPELIPFKFSVSQRMLNLLEFIRKKGRHPNIEEMVSKALRIYRKIVDNFGEFGHTVQLRWPHDDWGDGARWIDMASYFRGIGGDIELAGTKEPLVHTFTLNETQSVHEQTHWTMASVGISTFEQLVELAVKCYAILLDCRNYMPRNDPHLRIKKKVLVTRRSWLRPWKTHTKKVWDEWVDMHLSALLAAK